jgi:hypothetical protein
MGRRFERGGRFERHHVDRRIKIRGPLVASVSTIADTMDTGESNRTPYTTLLPKRIKGEGRALPESPVRRIEKLRGCSTDSL